MGEYATQANGSQPRKRFCCRGANAVSWLSKELGDEAVPAVVRRTDEALPQLREDLRAPDPPLRLEERALLDQAFLLPAIGGGQNDGDRDLGVAAHRQGSRESWVLTGAGCSPAASGSG